MITSNFYLASAYIFVSVVLLGVGGLYLWRNIALTRQIQSLAPHHSQKQKNKQISLLLRFLPVVCFGFFVVIIIIYLDPIRLEKTIPETDIMLQRPAPEVHLPLLGRFLMGGERFSDKKRSENSKVEQFAEPSAVKAVLESPPQKEEAFFTAPAKDRITLVNFWASWCAPCRTEHPLLMQLAQDSRLDMIGINYKDKDENALHFLHQLGNPFLLIAADKRGRGAIEWGVYGIPETYLVNKQGIIIYRHIGPLTPGIVTRDILPAIDAATP